MEYCIGIDLGGTNIAGGVATLDGRLVHTQSVKTGMPCTPDEIADRIAALCRSLAVDLPDTEIVSIAMHIITAENEVEDMHSTILTAKVISELSAIVEHGMEIQLNKESFSYSRFCMHLRYLVQRMMHGSPLDAGNAMDSMFVTMRNEYPQVYACVQQIDTFLHGTYGWQCSKEEQLYLIMHIHRVCVERAED